jgi:hypothetical protein
MLRGGDFANGKILKRCDEVLQRCDLSKTVRRMLPAPFP